MQPTTVAVDVAKSVFQVAISRKPGRVDEEHRLSRGRFLPFFATQPTATVLLEACGSAHHWGRALEQLGHTVRLLPPHETRRYVRRTKTDRTDARALLEAARNEEIHAVPMSLRTPLAELCDEVTVLTCRLKDLERHLAAVAEQLPQVALLRTIPGIGLLNATALVACVGDVRRFPTGRHFASYLGLTPREHSSGGRAFH